MKYSQRLAFEKHLSSAAPDHFAEVYLLAVKDKEERQEVLDSLIKKWPHEITDGDPFSQTLFGGKRLVILREGAKEKKTIEDFMAAPHSDVTLVVCMASLSAPILKLVEKRGVILDLTYGEKPWEKEKRIKELLKSQALMAHKQMTSDALETLYTSTNYPEQELEKLIIYTDERQKITIEDVHAVVTSVPTATVWELVDAFITNDKKAFLNCWHILEQMGESPFPIIRLLRKQAQNAILIKKGETPRIPQKALETLSQFTAPEKKLIALDTLELDLKNSTHNRTDVRLLHVISLT